MEAFEKTLFGALLDVMGQVWNDLPPSANEPAAVATATPVSAIEQKAA
jgi:hypothetical protein